MTAHQAPRPPPGFEVPPQPSTSGWVPPGPPAPRSRRDSSASESEASEGKSVASVRDSTSARLADLIYEVCPDSRPLFDARAPRCGFEAWFGQPEAAASKQRFRMYPRVAEVQEEVAARSEALARRAKPLSRVIPARARAYAVADDAVFASSQPGNSSFAQLAGSRAVGSRRWGSITFGDGTVGAVIPGSAGGDVFVSLADVWNTCHAEEGQLSASLMLLLFLLGIAVPLSFVGIVHLSVKGKLISSTLLLKNVSGPYPKKSSTTSVTLAFPHLFAPMAL